MIELFYWPTPNVHKVSILLEECGAPYTIKTIDIFAGDQFSAAFDAVSPNHKVPAIRDTDAGNAPVSVFESNCILLYLAEKFGRFYPAAAPERAEMMQWLFWQAAGLGPMSGQNNHFVRYAPEKIPYAMERYVKETNRLYGVLERRLAERAFVSGREFGLADMACYPWISLHATMSQNIEDFPRLRDWLEVVRARPAVKAAYALAKTYRPAALPNDEQRQVIFNQDAASVRAHMSERSGA